MGKIGKEKSNDFKPLVWACLQEASGDGQKNGSLNPAHPILSGYMIF